MKHRFLCNLTHISTTELVITFGSIRFSCSFSVFSLMLLFSKSLTTNQEKKRNKRQRTTQLQCRYIQFRLITLPFALQSAQCWGLLCVADKGATEMNSVINASVRTELITRLSSEWTKLLKSASVHQHSKYTFHDIGWDLFVGVCVRSVCEVHVERIYLNC